MGLALLYSDGVVCTWAALAVGVVAGRTGVVTSTASVGDEPCVCGDHAAPGEGVAIWVAESGGDGVAGRSPGLGGQRVEVVVVECDHARGERREADETGGGVGGGIVFRTPPA